MSDVQKFVKDHWFDIIIYILVILAVWSVLSRELIDLTCADEQGEECSNLSDDKQVALSPGKGDDSDSIETLLDKIAFTARYEQNTVFWRRIVLTSLIVGFILVYVFKRKFPRALDLITAVVIIFAAFYALNSFYQPVVTDKAVQQIDNNISLIESKL